MDRTIILSAAILAGLAVNSNAADQTQDFTNFSKVDASAGVNVTIAVGEAFAVAAQSDRDADLDRLEMRRDGDTLVIRQNVKRGWSWGLFDLANRRKGDIHVDVSMPQLAEVASHAGANVTATGDLSGDLVARATSGSDLLLKGATDATLSLSASSGADLTVEGGCQAATLDASSGADLDARDLACDAVIAHASSGADIETRALSRIIAKASSGGDIRVYAAPADRDFTSSSSGDIRVMN